MIVSGGTVPCDVSLVFGPKHFGCSFLLSRQGFVVVSFGVVVGKSVASLIVWALVVVCGWGDGPRNVLMSTMRDSGLGGCCIVFVSFLFLCLLTKYLVVWPPKELAL